MSFWTALQLFILVVETYVRWNVTSKKRKRRMCGYVTGVFAQFPWLIVFIHTQQWYLLMLLVLDGGIWFRGIEQNKRKPNHEDYEI
jgi:hypothetical protein